MSEILSDQRARDRFRDEWDRNFAVSANAGSGKTTAISERLAALALAPAGAELLRKTAVVTFTRKAAVQIGQRARQVLLRRLAEERRADLRPLDDLERAFFGTIHSFCLLLAQRYGQTLGLNLNPAVVAENDEALWEEFLEQDSMQFAALPTPQVDAFLRHAPLESIFDLARRFDLQPARHFLGSSPPARPSGPAAAVLQEILAASTRPGKPAEALKRNQETAIRWLQRYQTENTYLPFAKPEGTAAGIKEFYARFYAPLKTWLANTGAVLAAELALRYRAWRFDRGVQTYPDQVEAALAVLQDPATLSSIRAEDWRVILDEAQDTDAQQFAVLVEITRPQDAPLRTWPGGGPGPRPGRFCMVGDGQQAIYGSRADIRNFQKHLEAFAHDDGGERLNFDVTFRTPQRVITLLNTTLPAAFGESREHNLGLPVAAGAPPPCLQVPYKPLTAGPANVTGGAGRLPLAPIGADRPKVGVRLAAEVKQIAGHLQRHGPGGVGARNWGEICLLAPRNEWLMTARKELEAAGLKVALQMRKNRNGDNPVYAWISGLLAAVCDPNNAFEWTGVLREVFAIDDGTIAAALRSGDGFHWDEPERHPEPLRAALAVLKDFVERVDTEGETLARFATDLVQATRLAGKARLVDPSGGLVSELERLLAQAANLGLEGAGPREWLRQLLDTREDGRPAGKPSDDAINLLTSYSAKGLEWPVVIPIGLWRRIRKQTDEGLRLVADASGGPAIYFDNESLPDATREAQERERLRELIRLLYVTLTRPRRVLVLPWGAEFAEADIGSFADLWGAGLDGMNAVVPPVPEPPASDPTSSPRFVEAVPLPLASKAPAFPERLLPHQLVHQRDLVRTARHESGLDEPAPLGREDPIEYGLWWHEMMEFLPWRDGESAVNAYFQKELGKAAAKGFMERAEQETALLQASELWHELRSERWVISSELSVLAPLGEAGWVDGVIDLIAHDQAGGNLLIIDWKTNRTHKDEGDDAWLRRLVEEYRPQLTAYGKCLVQFFPKQTIKLGIYATGAGRWREL